MTSQPLSQEQKQVAANDTIRQKLRKLKAKQDQLKTLKLTANQRQRQLMYSSIIIKKSMSADSKAPVLNFPKMRVSSDNTQVKSFFFADQSQQ